jgi:hypothetical protein
VAAHDAGDAAGIVLGSVAIVLLLVLRQVRTPGVITWPAVTTLVAFARSRRRGAGHRLQWPAVAS